MVSISVVMPTYNQVVPVLKRATESILSQTFHDFEFIIIDDGSTNESTGYLSSLRDERVYIIRNETNLGITKSLNIGFRAAKGKYIARMDSDDYSYPDRFQKQFDFMERHPDVIMCGSNPVRQFGRFSMDRYKVKMLFMNPGPLHPSAFFNHEKLNQYNLQYDESLPYAQDYAMWAEIIRHGNVYLLPHRLVDYTRSRDRVSVTHRSEQVQCLKATQKKLLLQLLDTITEEELDLHYRYSILYNTDLKMSPAVRQWYKRLIKANNQRHIYPKYMFRFFVYRIMLLRYFPIIQSGREMVASIVSKLNI